MQHEAGRELDALVAEKVMGIEIPQWLEVPEGLTTLTSREIVPPYSTDIAAAWLVVDYLRALPNGGVWLEELSGRYSEGYRCGFSWTKNASSTDFRQAIGDTAPLAICLAALEAMEARHA